MRLTEVGIKNYKSATILNESWQQLTEAQKLHVGQWETKVWPLVEQYSRLLEAELTVDQIKSIFKNAEQVSIEQGTGKTALGKASDKTKEVTGKMKAEIDKLLKQAQNSEPVKNMDSQFDKLRGEISNKVGSMKGGDKILSGVDKWKSYAKENPMKSSFIIGAMTSVLAFASGGIASGAAIGFFLKLANNTIKGDKLSTAVGKSAKTAAIGGIAGALGDAVAGGIDIEQPEAEGAPQDVSSEVDSDDLSDESNALADMTEEQYKQQYAEQFASQFRGMTPEMISKIADEVTITGDFPNNFESKIDGTIIRGNIYVTPEEMSELRAALGDSPMSMLNKEGTDWIKANIEGADTQISSDVAAQSDEPDPFAKFDAGDEGGAESNAQPLDLPPYMQDLSDTEAVEKYASLQKQLDKFTQDGNERYTQRVLKLISGMETEYPQLQDQFNDVNTLSQEESVEESIWTALDAYEANYYAEGPLAKAAGGFAKSVGGVASGAVKAVGKGITKGAKAAGSATGKAITQKVTTVSLTRAWKKAGKPTTTDGVVQVLQSLGMADEQIGLVGKQSSVNLKSSSTVDTKKLAAQIKKLGLSNTIKTALTKNA